MSLVGEANISLFLALVGVMETCFGLEIYLVISRIVETFEASKVTSGLKSRWSLEDHEREAFIKKMGKIVLICVASSAAK